MPEREFLSQIDLFASGEEGYHTYRIPALATTAKATVLAFCEGRKHSRSDAGKIDLLLRRSADGGHSWGPTQVVVTDSDMTCGNPCPVVATSGYAEGMNSQELLAEGFAGVLLKPFRSVELREVLYTVLSTSDLSVPGT